MKDMRAAKGDTLFQAKAKQSENHKEGLFQVVGFTLMAGFMGALSLTPDIHLSRPLSEAETLAATQECMVDIAQRQIQQQVNGARTGAIVVIDSGNDEVEQCVTTVLRTEPEENGKHLTAITSLIFGAAGIGSAAAWASRTIGNRRAITGLKNGNAPAP